MRLVCLAIVFLGELTTPQGAFGAHPGHDIHLLGTLSAIQILIIQQADSELATVRDRLVDCTYDGARSDLVR
jgi:prenyltransferase beta subunit